MFTQRQRHNSCGILLLNRKFFSSQKQAIRFPDPDSFSRVQFGRDSSPKKLVLFVYFCDIIFLSFCGFDMTALSLLALAGLVLTVG